MNNVNRSIPGLREAMYDVLDKLRQGDLSLSAARVQVDTAKTICLTVVSEYKELQVLQKQIEVQNQVALLENNSKVIDHE